MRGRRSFTIVWAVLVGLLATQFLITCASSQKVPSYFDIRDLRYSRELQIEMIEPRFPRQTWLGTAPQLTTAEESIDVQGRIRDREARVQAFLNGRQVPVDGPAADSGEFWIRNLKLTEGENEIIITAKRSTKSNEARFTVTRTAESKIEIATPLADSFIKEKWVTVKGVAELQLTQLQVNGIAGRRVSEKSREFIVEGVNVRDGENILVATGKDDDGNVWRSSTKIMRDVVPPLLTVDYPPPDATTNQGEITIEGSIDEPKARLTLNGREVPLDPLGRFSVSVPLQGLEGRYKLEATDAAGNTAVATRNVRIDTTKPGINVMEPRSGGQISVLPTSFRFHSSKVPAKLQLLVDDGVAAEAKVTESPFTLTLSDLDVPDGNHWFTLRVSDEAGNQAEQKLALSTDLKGPKIDIRGVANGMTAERIKVDVAVSDPSLVKNSVRITLNGKPFSSGRTLDYRSDGEGEKLLRVEAQDGRGHAAAEEVRFNLGRNDLKYFLEEIERLWTMDSRRKGKLIDPLIADLRASGALTKVLASYRQIAEDPHAAPPHPTDPDIVETFRAFEALYPEPYRMKEVKSYYEGNRDLARDGIYQDLAEVFAIAYRIGAADIFDKLLLAISAPDDKGHSPLTDVLLAADVFARYPRRDKMFEALTHLPDIDLDFNPKTPDDMFDLPLEFFSAFFEQPKEDFEGLIDYQSKIAEKGAHKLGLRIFHELIDTRRGPSFIDQVYEPLTCVLDQKTNRPYDRMLRAWGGFVHAYVNDPRRQQITESVLNFWQNALQEDVLDSAAILMDYRDLPALHEAFQVLSQKEVFDKALTDVSKILTTKDLEGRPLPYTMLIAMDGFFERDEVHPNQTYMETILDGVERLLQRDAEGNNSLEIVIDAFLDNLTQEQRLRFGEIFKYHTLPTGEKVPAKGREFPSDNVRLLKLMDIAYSPLSCGMPIAFTDVIVPINLPGIPIKFPTENLAVAAFEASVHTKAETVQRFAAAFDFLVSMATIGDMFCEPDILAEMVADPAPIRALLKDTPLAEMFIMIQALARRGDAPYLVEMIHSLYLSGASGLFDPTMNAVFEQGVVENFIASLKAVRDTRLPSNPKRKALSVFLDAAANTLRVPPGRRHRLVRPFLMLFDRILSDDKTRENAQVFFEWVGSVLKNPPPGLDLHDLDNIFGEIAGCDKYGNATRGFARFLDDKKDNGDIRHLLPHARTYLDAPPELAIAFNRVLGRVLQDSTVTESLFLLKKWVELDKKYDRVLQESLGEVLRPDRRDNAPVDPLIYGVVHTAAPTIKAERERIRSILRPENRDSARRLMRYPFNAMEINKRAGVSYMEQAIPAARIMFTKKDPATNEYYMNSITRGFHVLIREKVTTSLIGAHEVAYRKGYYNIKRDQHLLGEFADIMDYSLGKWQRQARAE